MTRGSVESEGELARACPACARPVDAGDAFCRVCGQRLAIVASSPGERRQLTVMFCDLVDSTAIAAGLDPEDVQQLLAAYHSTGAAIVGSFGGHVAQYLGDGLLVYFGFPLAYEDAPKRAVGCGLRLADAIPGLVDSVTRAIPGFRGPLAVRIGIHTGPVALGAAGADAPADGLAMGSTVNVAARLAATAQPGQVVISQDCADRVSTAFRLASLGPLSLKGIGAPVPAFQALAPRRDPARRWRSPFTGRDALLARLDAAWRDALAGGGRPLLLIGEAGIGKSRLAAAFRATLSTPHRWLTCQGVALQQGTPLYPLLEALGAAGLLPPALATLRGPARPRTPAERNADLDAMVDLCLEEARRQPLVLLAEDLHWFDPTSLDLLGRLATRLDEAPILLLATSRPEPAPDWAATATQLTVPPLTANEIAALVADLLGGLPSESMAVQQLAARSEGVPLFAEELSRAMLEQAGESDDPPAVPGSLQDLFAARLDRLGPAKGLVQIAALIGRSFDAALVARVSNSDADAVTAALRLAAARQILHEQRDGATPRFVFHHALLQEAASNAMLRSRRREAHGRIADALAAPDAPPQPGVVAHHLAAAGRDGEALVWYNRAGREALDQANFREAEAALSRAAALHEKGAAASDSVALDLYSALNRVRQLTHGYAAAPTIAAARIARELAERSGSIRQLLREEERLLQAVLTQGDYAGVAAQADRLVELAQAGGRDRDMLLIASNARVQVCFFTGDLAGVDHHYARLLPLAEEVGRRQPPGNLVSAHGIAAMAAAMRGDQTAAETRIATALAFAAETGHAYDQAMALHYECQLRSAQYRNVEAMAAASALMAWADAHGFAYLAALAGGVAAWVRGVAGEPDQARQLRAIVDGQIAAGSRIAVTKQLNRLGEVELAAGDVAAAAATAERALTFNDQERVYRSASLALVARVAAAGGHHAEAEADFRAAMAEAEAIGAHAEAEFAAAGLAALVMPLRQSA